MNTSKKIALFRRYFSGLPHVYGTYDPQTRRSYTVWEPVTDAVIFNHLQGTKPYGVYLLVKDRTRALAVDFDQLDPEPVLRFLHRARHYQLPVYIERSKSKGYHGWMFFAESGVLAAKARLVIQQILREIELPSIEIFPKQDVLTARVPIGNFINTPLFGALVPQGRTVFVDPEKSLEPFPDPWEFLQNIQIVSENLLDEIIAVNELHSAVSENQKENSPYIKRSKYVYGLLPCAQRILQEGVTGNQRVICFRLAVQLKRVGLPCHLTTVLLKEWAQKNCPVDGKQIITISEIAAQTAWAYRKEYGSYGCEDPAIQPYCNPQCPLLKKKSDLTDSSIKTNSGGKQS